MKTFLKCYSNDSTLVFHYIQLESSHQRKVKLRTDFYRSKKKVSSLKEILRSFGFYCQSCLAAGNTPPVVHAGGPTRLRGTGLQHHQPVVHLLQDFLVDGLGDVAQLIGVCCHVVHFYKHLSGTSHCHSCVYHQVAVRDFNSVFIQEL